MEMSRLPQIATLTRKPYSTDYVLKQRLERLVPCVHRALKEARVERDRQEMELALKESEARFRSCADFSYVLTTNSRRKVTTFSLTRVINN